MSDAILVLVKHLDEIEPARAVATALKEQQLALSFANEDLRTRFGESAHSTSTDPFEHVLNAEQFGLVLCFQGARELGAHSNYLLLSYFDELGVPTVELQRDLLRDPKKAREQSSARHYLAWSGSEGTGYLKAEPAARALDAPVRDDVVLVTSQLANAAYSEEQRYQFAFGVMRLAREYPQLCFLWRASAAEEQSGEAKLVLAMLGSSGPQNLWLEDNEPVDALLARASGVVTMAQTALLDYVAVQKPTLVYAPHALDARLTELSLTRFTRPSELLLAFRALRAEPSSFLVASRIPRFRPALLAAQLMRIAAINDGSVPAPLCAPKAERRELTLRYLAYMQDVRARAELGRLSPQVNALEKRVAEMEKLLTSMAPKASGDAAKLPGRKSEKRPLSVTQKAWKLAREVKKRAFK
jgi:hypothetical protein